MKPSFKQPAGVGHELLPAFIAVGPQKTGTTWIYSLLEKSEHVCLPKDVKETMFFELYYKEGADRYLSYFSHCSGVDKICGEVAPSYFDVYDAPTRIYEMNPECKVIISLRNPAERAFSLYLHHLRKGRVPASLEEAVSIMPRILESGYYKKHINRWLSVFERRKVMFVIMDDIKKTPKEVLSQICSFLEIEFPSLEEENSTLTRKVNASGMPRSVKLAQIATVGASFLRENRMDRTAELLKRVGLKKLAYSGGESRMPEPTLGEMNYLSGLYQEDVDFVESLLKRSLSDWKK